MTKPVDRRALVGMLVAVVIAAVAIIGDVVADAHLGGWGSALSGAGVIVIALAITVVLRHRGVEAGVLLSGQPQDERQRDISRRAGNLTGIVACGVAVGGYIVSALTGAHAQAQAFGLMMTICGGTFIGATVVIGRRS